MLGSMLDTGADMPATHVADVFAGSGGMGLEALSRGASFCWFFENGRQARQTLDANIASLEAGTEGRVIAGDAWTALPRIAAESPIEVAFLDPPYAQSLDVTGDGRVCQLLGAMTPCASRCLIVLHHEAKVTYGSLPVARWEIVDQRSYGTNGITIFSHEA